MNSIAFAVIVLVVLGLAGGIILVLASKFMAVYEDPRIAQITECLAGANCGGCGYAGCADYAKAIVENGAPTTTGMILSTKPPLSFFAYSASASGCVMPRSLLNCQNSV